MDESRIEMLLSAYVDREVSAEEAAQVEEFLATSPRWREVFRQFAGIKWLFGQHRAPQHVWGNIEKQISPKEREHVVPFLMREVLRLSEEISELRERIEELEMEKQLRELSHLERRFAERFPLLGKVELN